MTFRNQDGRSEGHVHMVHLASKRTPVEVVAVCDIWSVQKLFGTAPETYKYSEKMLSSYGIDGVMIATGDFQHAKLCVEVVQGKDCSVEKPFANVLEEAKAARDTLKAPHQVVQVSAQHRRHPYPPAVRDIIRSGRIGKIARISQEWNVNQPRWRQIPVYDDGKSPTLLKCTSRSMLSMTYPAGHGRESPLKYTVHGPFVS